MFYASIRFKISLRKSVHVASSHYNIISLFIYFFFVPETLFIYLFIYLFFTLPAK